MIDEIFKICDSLIESCDIDFQILTNSKIDRDFFDNYSNIRVINSFLFNFSKLQDKIGAKLFRKLLFELKEIDKENIPMIDLLNILEKLEIITNSRDWDRLREIRNSLTHEYPFNIEERIENIKMAIQGYQILKQIYDSIKLYAKRHQNSTS